MRRIYESDALHRDDEDAFTPSRQRSTEPQSMRWIDSTAWSRRLVPTWLRYRAISVSVTTPRTEYPAGATIPFDVTLKNGAPFPVTLRTPTPRLWRWDVDGVVDASKWDEGRPREEPYEWQFGRGERKRFRRHWQAMFRISERKWEPADVGDHTIGVALNVPDVPERLEDAVTVTIAEPK